MSAWLPIETAPKDGTIILVAGHGYNGRGPWYVTPAKWDCHTWMQYDPLADAAEEYKGEYTIESDKHTHWMPLPDPPVRA